MNVNKCTRAGGEFTFWVADWFALMNDKMGGDLVKIRVRIQMPLYPVDLASGLTHFYYFGTGCWSVLD